ncbi:D-hexose-6-phosphate mutarotase, partial [Streptomyces sp. tea 10]|nr:D-hexose-6-phosphate mutarotase [Streptomyces sp. tea 10]
MTRLPEPLSLSCADGSGSVLSYGAHVVSWAPEDHEPVLWVSSRSYNETGRAVRGGVPICFPWFGPGRTGDMDPAHGFARITEWQLAEQGEDTEGHAYAEFTLTPADVAEHLRETFPHEFEARFRVTVGARL